MQYKQLRLSVLLLLWLGITGLQAQKTIIASGGKAIGSGGSVCYSIGQIGTQKLNGTNGSVSEGVQQPYEISVISSIDEAESIKLTISAYPNPVKNILHLSSDNMELSTLNFQLFDAKGKLLLHKVLVSNVTSINMSNFVPATYFVKILKKNTVVKTFKIIKN
ncbi:MAG: T9SS type A sorting domain-containing protein [Bacteroidales bacterium]|nr:T9SS type A sorting domain-containing protein [Bacteroidales bacterium]